jgi:hypothetical protein
VGTSGFEIVEKMDDEKDLEDPVSATDVAPADSIQALRNTTTISDTSELALQPLMDIMGYSRKKAEWVAKVASEYTEEANEAIVSPNRVKASANDTASNTGETTN